MSTSRVPWLYRVVRDRSGQSEPLAVVLILVVVVMATGTLFVAGSAAVEDGRKAVAVSQAEQAFMELDSKTSLVGLGETDTQELDLGLDQTKGSLRVTDAGRISVELLQLDGDGKLVGVTDPIVSEKPLGTVTYEYDDTVVAYQGGGVWRSDGEGSVMVSRPEFHYNGETLTLPIVSLGGSQTLQGDVRVSAVENSYSRLYPSDFKDEAKGVAFVNEVPQATPADSKIRVTVQSDYYQAWAAYFAEATNGEVGSDPVTETAWVVLDAKPGSIRLGNGVIATSGEKRIKITGNGAYLDTYDSRNGKYTIGSITGNGELVSASDIEVGGSAEITGGLVSGGDVTLTGGAIIYEGSVSYTNAFTGDPTQVVDGTVESIDGVDIPDANDAYVQGNVDSLASTNDNARVASTSPDGLEIVDGELQFDGSSGTLTAGRYYLHTLDYEGKTLYLDTSGGDVIIAVRDYVAIGSSSNAATLEVLGDGPSHAIIYVGGADTDGTTKTHLSIAKASSVLVPNDQAKQLRIYGKSDMLAEMTGSEKNGKSDKVVFQGVIFAPAGVSGTGGTTLSHAEIYGAIVTGTLDINQYTEFHYDEGLGNIDLQIAESGTNIRQLHVTEREVTVDDE